ncbi:MAG: carboxypeptidase-like regulatory domain-containing protein, partial [Bacteroidetes bacterium]|nr:carboxypeptidase-like regulatory domain-containing protein [Bacteroidota bacterium]
MKAPILLHIPEPCNENWDAMTPQDKGRHCQSCNKVVVDFSVMSDRQVLDYFKNAQGNTCGRFHNDQLQRPLIEPQKQPGKWNYFVASVISFFIGVKSFGQAKLQGKVAFPTQKATPQTNELQLTKGEVSAPELTTVSGKVTDEKGAAIAGASIVIDKTNKGVVSDKDGNFLCKAKSITSLTIRASNYETRRIQVKNNENLVIKLAYINDSIEKVIVQVPYGVVKQTYFTGTPQTISAKEIKAQQAASFGMVKKAPFVCRGERTITAKEIEAHQAVSFTKALEGIVGEVSSVDNKLKGKIIDDKGTTIPGASIQIKGTKLGTTSKADGSFELNKLGSNTQLTIVVSSLKKKKKTIEVESKDLKNSLTI